MRTRPCLKCPSCPGRVDRFDGPLSVVHESEVAKTIVPDAAMPGSKTCETGSSMSALSEAAELFLLADYAMILELMSSRGHGGNAVRRIFRPAYLVLVLEDFGGVEWWEIVHNTEISEWLSWQ